MHQQEHEWRIEERSDQHKKYSLCTDRPSKKKEKNKIARQSEKTKRPNCLVENEQNQMNRKNLGWYERIVVNVFRIAYCRLRKNEQIGVFFKNSEEKFKKKE